MSKFCLLAFMIKLKLRCLITFDLLNPCACIQFHPKLYLQNIQYVFIGRIEVAEAKFIMGTCLGLRHRVNLVYILNTAISQWCRIYKLGTLLDLNCQNRHCTILEYLVKGVLPTKNWKLMVWPLDLKPTRAGHLKIKIDYKLKKINIGVELYP